jgi:hypothetical protein
MDIDWPSVQKELSDEYYYMVIHGVQRFPWDFDVSISYESWSNACLAMLMGVEMA